MKFRLIDNSTNENIVIGEWPDVESAEKQYVELLEDHKKEVMLAKMRLECAEKRCQSFVSDVFIRPEE